MISNFLDRVEQRSVWMTESGYPAIIEEVTEQQIAGLVISPSGPTECSWCEDGKNTKGQPSFFDLKYPPELIAYKLVIIKNGVLIGSSPDLDDATTTAEQNGADLVCEHWELVDRFSRSSH